MTRLYRISKREFATDLSGEGARRFGGRWNQKGVPLLYTAESVAQATLEVLVHTSLTLIPSDLALVVLQLPADLPCRELNVGDLPPGWSSYPAPNYLAQIGTDWVRSKETLSLRLPSSVVPDGAEANVLLNPAHPDSCRIEILEVKDYQFDERLFRR